MPPSEDKILVELLAGDPAAPRGAYTESQGRCFGCVFEGYVLARGCEPFAPPAATCLAATIKPLLPNLLLLLCAARGEAMNRLLARLDGLPLYLLWGEKVGSLTYARGQGWMAGQTGAVLRSALARADRPHRSAKTAYFPGCGRWHPHALSRHPTALVFFRNAGPLVRPCSRRPDPALLPRRHAHRHQQRPL